VEDDTPTWQLGSSSNECLNMPSSVEQRTLTRPTPTHPLVDCCFPSHDNHAVFTMGALLLLGAWDAVLGCHAKSTPAGLQFGTAATVVFSAKMISV
jgi:hypothetical protein